MIRLIPQPKRIIEKGGICTEKDNIICIKDSSIKNDEGYKLQILPDGIKIYASDEKGFFYGKTTLKQIKIQLGEKLPCLEIEDTPEYLYRGFMLDCARHMFSVEEIKKLIDAAALIKMNKFHWHLSDDQGFRIELESYPELTRLGSVRKCDNFGSMCRSDKEYSGYYTKKEIADIIEYCKERFIDVIPEIDMPGHTSAILHVFPKLSCRKEPVEVKTRQGIYKDNLCVGDERTGIFLRNLLDELCEMFPGEYFHIGGDEAPDDYRKDCPYCQCEIHNLGLSNAAELQCVFSNYVKNYLKGKGKKAIVWNDILKGEGLDKDIIVQRWMDPKNKAHKAANKGNKIIISDFKPYYFDYPYGMYPLKNVYKFNPAGGKALSETGRKNILGTETPVWTEFIDNNERLEYLTLPRWFAVAENAWSSQKDKDYEKFKSAAIKLCDYLNKNGYNCAPESDTDMPITKRLADVVKFFKAFLSNKQEEK